MPEDIGNKIRSIAKLSDKYKEQILFKRWPNKDDLLNDPTLALDFFFGHVFYQGRNDELSERFERIAEWVIKAYYPDLTILANTEPDLTERSPLETTLKEAGLPKRGDRLRVLDTLELLRTLPGANIVAYSVDEVRHGRFINLYSTLCRIRWVADKTSSFYLRDLDFTFDLNDHLSSDDFDRMQPIDTWVEKISKKIGLVDRAVDDKYLCKRLIINGCLDAGVNPNEYNAGAWWCGKYRVAIA